MQVIGRLLLKASLKSVLMLNQNKSVRIFGVFITYNWIPAAIFQEYIHIFWEIEAENHFREQPDV
jgi:hypothetical protein